MRLKHYKYSLNRRVEHIKTRTAVALSVIGLALGGGTGLTALAFSTAHAAPAPNWQLHPGALIFTCGGSDYNHTLQTVNENQTSGDFTGTGAYDADAAYTWNITGNVSGSNVTFQLVYNGANSGYTLKGTGSVAGDGSVSGTVDGNCQTFSMPAGTATHYCVPVETSKGSLTAAQVGGTVTGDVDATGCDIGAYFNTSHPGSVDGAHVHDANQYGVLVDGLEAGNTTVNVTSSHVYNIGHHTGTDFAPNGGQAGVGVYYTGYHTAGTVAGTVSGSTVDHYQKAGVVTNGAKAAVSVNDNTVTGLADVPFIAQDGIQFGYGAQGSARGNTIDGNWYTGAGWTSTGMLLFDVKANQVKVSNNKYLHNQTNHSMVEYSACPHQYGGFYEDYGLCES